MSTSPHMALGALPARMKVLYITTLNRTGRWLSEAFAVDSAAEIQLEEAVGVTAGLTRLRDEVFDAVLISHEPGVLDALDLIEGLRGGGTQEPLMVLGTAPADQIEALAFEVGADAYLCVSQTTTRSLLWTFARAIERHILIRENRRLLQVERQRLQQEHHEAELLIGQQRALITRLEALKSGVADGNVHDVIKDESSNNSSKHCAAREVFDATQSSTVLASLPPPLVQHYREILRTYVIMGTGNLSREMTLLAELLAVAGVGGREAMQLHLHVLEELVEGLGARSARHVMNRADLLVLDVFIHLVENYRQRRENQQHPPEQRMLPGFEPTSPTFLRAA